MNVKKIFHNASKEKLNSSMKPIKRNKLRSFEKNNKRNKNFSLTIQERNSSKIKVFAEKNPEKLQH